MADFDFDFDFDADFSAADPAGFASSDFGEEDFGISLGEQALAEEASPVAEVVAPEDTRTFMSEAERSLKESGQLVKHVATTPLGETLETAGEGIVAGVRGLKAGGLEGALDAASEFAKEVLDNPAAAAGGMVGELPLALLTGGGGALAARQVMKGALKAGVSPAAAGAGTVIGGGLAAGTAGAAGAGLRAESQGREINDKEAASAATLAGMFGFVGGAGLANKGTVIGKDSYVGRVANKISQSAVRHHADSFAKWLDPMLWAERKADTEGKGGGVYNETVADLTDLSHASEKVRDAVAREIDPMYKLREKLTKEEEAVLLRELEEVDRGGETTAVTDIELSALGLSDNAVKLFRGILGVAAGAYRKAAGVSGRRMEGRAPYGRIPHVWEGEFRIFFDGDAGKTVRGFDTLSEARAFQEQTGGLLLDENKFKGYSVEDILESIDAKKIATQEELIDTIRKLKGRRVSNLEGMGKARKNVQGYTTFRDIDSVIDAVRRANTVAHTGDKVTPLVQKLDVTRAEIEKRGDMIGAEVLRSTLDRVHGSAKAKPWASGSRAAAFHMILGFFNHVAPMLNVASAIIFTPAYLMREARRAGGDPSLLTAMRYTAEALPSLMPEKLRKAMPKFTNEERVLINGAEGHIPTPESVRMGDKTANARLNEYVTGTFDKKPALQRKLAKATDILSKVNTWQMRHTESAARRMISVAFRKLADDMELDPKVTERFINKGVTKVAGDFNKGMRAAVLEGDGTVLTDAMSVALTFQTYIWKKGFEMFDMLKHDRKAFFTMVTPLLTLAGVSGMPLLLSGIDAMIEALDDDGSLSKEWDEFKHDNPKIFFGALSQLPVDASGRMALTLPFGVGSEYGMNPLGISQMFLKAAGQAAEGDIEGALRGTAPSDLFRAIGGAKALMGERDEEGRVTYAPPTKGKYKKEAQVTPEAAAMAALLGVPPAEVVAEDRRVRANNERIKRQRDRVSAIRKKFHRTMARGDMTREKELEFIKKLRKVDPTLYGKRLGRKIKGWREQSEKYGKRYAVKPTRFEQRLVSPPRQGAIR